jgi:hypothetical protein
MNEQFMSSMSDLDIVPIGPLKSFAAPQAIDKLESTLNSQRPDIRFESFIHEYSSE